MSPKPQKNDQMSAFLLGEAELLACQSILLPDKPTKMVPYESAYFA